MHLMYGVAPRALRDPLNAKDQDSKFEMKYSGMRLVQAPRAFYIEILMTI